ncbi:MAG: hypothetical protein MUC88_03765 [Planctomycetes bacterium]|jgi:hypothetical protein|nr:hypothetical protein [Planctomycetota bacterium]
MEHLRIVNETLAGERPADEQTHAAVAILAERLERLKQRSSLFAEIGFSPHVKRLKPQAQAMALGY